MIIIIAEKMEEKLINDDWFGSIWFYDISSIVGYLIPNPVYTYILKMCMICKHIL